MRSLVLHGMESMSQVNALPTRFVNWSFHFGKSDNVAPSLLTAFLFTFQLLKIHNEKFQVRKVKLTVVGHSLGPYSQSLGRLGLNPVR
jgi:hypothetical protein